MEEKKQLKDMSVTELKAVKSDIYEEQQNNARVLQMINAEIAQRSEVKITPGIVTGTEPVDMNTNKSGTHETNNS